MGGKSFSLNTRSAFIPESSCSYRCTRMASCEGRTVSMHCGTCLGPFGSTLTANGITLAVSPVTARKRIVTFPRLLTSRFPDAAATVFDGGQIESNGALLHGITLETRAIPTQASIVRCDATRNLTVTPSLAPKAARYPTTSGHILLVISSSRYLISPFLPQGEEQIVPA
jgi:hypothetical protein